MDFQEASDRLTAAVTHDDIAREAGVSVYTVRQARLDPENPNRRMPPPGWQAAIARLARGRARDLERLAAELERAAGE